MVTVYAHNENEAKWLIQRNRQQSNPGQPGIVHVVRATTPTKTTNRKSKGDVL